MGFGEVLTDGRVRHQLGKIPLVPLLRDMFVLADMADHAATASIERPLRQKAFAHYVLRTEEAELFEELTNILGHRGPMASSAASLLTVALERLAVWNPKRQQLGDVNDPLVPTTLLTDLILHINQRLDDTNPGYIAAGQGQMIEFLGGMAQFGDRLTGPERKTVLDEAADAADLDRESIALVRQWLRAFRTRIDERAGLLAPTPDPWTDPWVVAIERLRSDLFAHRAAPRHWYEATHEIYFERLLRDPECAPAFGRFESNAGMTLQRAYQDGASFGLHADSSWDLLYEVITKNQFDGRMDLEGDELALAWAMAYRYRYAMDRGALLFDATAPGPDWQNQAFFDLVSRDLSDVVAGARIDLDSKSIYSFTTFYAKPIVRLTPTLGLVSHLRFLEEIAAPEGLFWPMIEHGRIRHATLSIRCGVALEQFGAARLKTVRRPEEELWSQDEIDAQWPRRDDRVCDSILYSPTLQLGAAFEFKQNFFSRSLRATAATVDVVDDMKKLVHHKFVKGLGQIAATIERIRNADTKDRGPILPIIVTGSSFRASPEIYDIVTGELAEVERLHQLSRGGQTLRRGYILMDVFDLIALTRCSTDAGVSLLEMLVEWQRSEQPELSALQWIASPSGPDFPSMSLDEAWYLNACEGREAYFVAQKPKRSPA
jgi:hypothetical protein